MATKYAEAGSLKEGSYIVIDGEPCRIVEIEKSKTGKHGSAKARIVAVGLFDGAKRTLSVPADAQVEVPIVNKFTAQVIAMAGEMVQLMDMRDYKTIEVPSSSIDEGIRNKLAVGVEVEIWEILGRYRVVRVR